MNKAHRSNDLLQYASILSADARILRGQKLETDSLAQSLVARNGYAAGLVALEQDRVIGANYRLQLRPDYETLGIPSSVSAELATIVERIWSLFSNSHHCYIDAARKRTFTQILREVIRHDVMHGECFILRQWRPSPFGFSTCFQLISPARVSNPNHTPNTARMRDGVELNEYGEEVAYHIRQRLPGDVGLDTAGANVWDRITRFNRFGVEQVLHITDQLEADQTRGISRFNPIIDKLNELDTYENAELDAAILGSLYTLVVKSEFGQQSAYDALGLDTMKKTLQMQAAFHKNSPLESNNTRVPHLFPGESLESVSNNHPAVAFRDFRNGHLFHVAKGSNVSYEEFSGDFSQTSYSSARASLEISERAVRTKRANIAEKAANKMMQLWAYEAMLKNALPDIGVDILNNPVLFEAAFQAKWLGAPKIIIDAGKAAKAADQMLRNGSTTLSAVCAENGEDFEDVLEQRAREIQKLKSLGLPLPSWAVQTDLDVADDVDLDEDNTDPENTAPGSSSHSGATG